VLKTGRTEEILEALRQVADGAQAFDPRHPQRPRGQAALSPREREVLRRVAAGETNRAIAAELGVSGETVKTLLARTYAKLGARRRAEAVAAAIAQGIL
jgi:DNA-binding NarL/FixJ family response regulator